MTFRLKTATFLFVFSLFLLPLVSNAQIPTSIDGVQISIFPESPAPGQKVTVSLESFSTTLDGASILWQVDGKNYNKGVGMKSVTILSPALGKTTTILAVIMTVEGREVKKSITIKSGSVDLVWESSGYTPPFYEGKSFFAYENELRVSAIPHLADSKGNQLDPRTLLYRWTVNDKVVQNQSGIGKQILTIQDDLPRELEITVEVSTPVGDNKASSRIVLTPGDPSISFYEDDPLYGVLYNSSLFDSVKLTRPEISVRAIPYSFTILPGVPLSFGWSINNVFRGDLSANESITLRTKEDTEGTSLVSLQVRNGNNILQSAKKSLNVSFVKRGAARDNSIF